MGNEIISLLETEKERGKKLVDPAGVGGVETSLRGRKGRKQRRKQRRQEAAKLVNRPPGSQQVVIAMTEKMKARKVGEASSRRECTD